MSPCGRSPATEGVTPGKQRPGRALWPGSAGPPALGNGKPVFLLNVVERSKLGRCSCQQAGWLAWRGHQEADGGSICSARRLSWRARCVLTLLCRVRLLRTTAGSLTIPLASLFFCLTPPLCPPILSPPGLASPPCCDGTAVLQTSPTSSCRPLLIFTKLFFCQEQSSWDTKFLLENIAALKKNKVVGKFT